MGIIRLKSLLTEALSELYHATDIWKLLNILKSNSLKLTFAGGSQADQQRKELFPFGHASQGRFLRFQGKREKTKDGGYS